MGDMADDLEAAMELTDQSVIDEDEALRERIGILQERYFKAKALPIHSIASCGCCNRKFQKKVKAQAFCSRRCKDTYWNTVDESRRVRAIVFNGGQQ